MPRPKVRRHEERHVRVANSFGKGRGASVRYLEGAEKKNDEGAEAIFSVPPGQWARMTPVERAASLLIPGASYIDRRNAERELRKLPYKHRAAAREEAKRLGRG